MGLRAACLGCLPLGYRGVTLQKMLSITTGVNIHFRSLGAEGVEIFGSRMFNKTPKNSDTCAET
jgi:hypothetical protein